MEMMDVDYTNKDNETTTCTGVPLNALLDLTQINVEATTLTLVADDGYTTDVDLAELRACTECIIAVQDDGSFRSVLHGFISGQQVKGLVEIQVR